MPQFLVQADLTVRVEKRVEAETPSEAAKLVKEMGREDLLTDATAENFEIDWVGKELGDGKYEDVSAELEDDDA